MKRIVMRRLLCLSVLVCVMTMLLLGGGACSSETNAGDDAKDGVDLRDPGKKGDALEGDALERDSLEGDLLEGDLLEEDALERDAGYGPEADPFVVMSLNLRTGLAMDGVNSWKYRESILMDMLEMQSPDLVGTQEGLLFQLTAITDRFPEYDWVGTGRNGTDFDEFCAIFFRKSRFSLLESDTFWLSDTPSIPESTFSPQQGWIRIVTWAHLEDRENHLTFHLFNTHFDTSQADEIPQRSAALLAQRIQEIAGTGPVLVVGDFNNEVGSPAWQILTGSLEYNGVSGALLDPWEILDIPEEGTFHGFTGIPTAATRIDWILHHPGADPLAAAVIRFNRDGLYPTDHFPVETTYRWADPSRARKNR